MTAVPGEAAARLTAGEVVTGDAGRPLPHHYEVAVPAGHYLRVTVVQRGLDVSLRLVSPDGETGFEIDTPNGAEGEEAAHAVAAAGGPYTVVVALAGDENPRGRYDLLARVRPAGATDRLRVEAETALAAAEAGRRSAASRAEDYAAALRLAERLGDPRLRGYNHYRLATLAGSAAEAELHCRRGLAAAAAAGDRRTEALLHNLLSGFLRRTGRIEEALAEQRQALALFRALQDATAVVETLAALGSTLDLLGDGGEALAAFEEALELSRPLPDRAVETDLRLQLGESLLSRGRLAEAADQFAHAARLAGEHGGERSVARAERGLGLVLSRRDDAAGAVDRFERTLTIARREGADALLAVTLADLATARLQLGEVAAARAALAEGLPIARRLGNESYEASMLHKLAQCHHAEGEHAESARLHAAAAEAFRRLGDPVALAGARYGLARAHHLAGDLRAGLKALEGALAAAEEVRGAAGGPDHQTAYLASKPHYRELHVELWMALHAREPQAGHDLAALLADDAGRARSLVALLRAARQEAAPPERDPERERLLRGLERLRLIAERLAAEPDEGEALAAVRRRQRELLLRLDRLRGDWQPAPGAQAAVAALTAESLDALRGDSLLLVYSLGERHSVLWALGEEGLRSTLLPPHRDLDDLARRVAIGLASPRAGVEPAAQRAAQELSRHLLAPVASELARHRRLAVVADGALHRVPFAALPDPAAPERPLVAAHEVVSLPSLSVLDLLRRRAAAPRVWRGAAAVIADPVFHRDDSRVAGAMPPAESPGPPSPVLTRALERLGLNSFPRLPGTRREAEALLDLLPHDAVVFRGFDFAADRAAVLAGALAGYRIVHIATHGLFDAEEPGGAGLVLSLVDEAGRPHDGHLQLHEVYELDLDAEVIVLSACQSGVGRDMAGEGLIGLTRGFLEAGAPQLVVSLWPVGDRGSAELTERFYRSWLVEGEAPSAALAAAQRSMWSEPEWSDPYHWAGFQIVGDWSASSLPGDPKDDPIEKTSSEAPKEPTKPDDPLPGGPPGKPTR